MGRRGGAIEIGLDTCILIFLGTIAEPETALACQRSANGDPALTKSRHMPGRTPLSVDVRRDTDRFETRRLPPAGLDHAVEGRHASLMTILIMARRR